MDEKVISLDSFRIDKRRNNPRSDCSHKHLVMHTDEERVTCEDCGIQLGAFAALKILSEAWGKLQRDIERRIQIAQHLETKTLTLRAAKQVEDAWRSRGMVPACPHCGEGILPEDDLGAMRLNKAMVLQRRAATSKPTGDSKQAEAPTAADVPPLEPVLRAGAQGEAPSKPDET